MVKSSTATDDVGTRLADLERGLMATRKPNNIYNGKASIKKLKRYVDEANECLEQYPNYDDGTAAPPYAMLGHQRRMAGLPSDPPSQMKVKAWSMVKISRSTLAEAYEETKNDEAVELYESLIEHCRSARVEIWEGESELHSIMLNLGLCLKRLR